MKKFLLAISITICFLFSFNEKSEAQYVTIPDTAFVNWLNANGFSTCMTGNQMDTTCYDIVNAGFISISGINIHDVYGIQYFDLVNTLQITNTSVDSIFFLPEISFTNIDLHSNSLLKHVFINPMVLYVSFNISNCNFDNFYHTNSLLAYNDCSFNHISSIVFPGFQSGYFNCSHNSLTELNLPNSYINTLRFNDNPSLNCVGFDNLTFDSLIFYNTGIACLPPIISCGFSNPNYQSYPSCQTFNPYGCVFTHGITGTIYQDLNSNCVLDSNETPISNIPVQLFSGTTLEQETFTNNTGTYFFSTPFTGTFFLAIDSTVSCFNSICPIGGIDTALINSVDSLNAGNDFSLQCNPIEDGIVASIVRDSGRFRPAGKALVNIRSGDIFSFYNTNCTGNLSGTVTATFSGPVSYDGVKAGSLVPTVTGSTLTWTIADFNTVDPYHDFHVRFITDTSAALGSAVCITATISINQTDANAANNSASNCFMVQTSFDPNYKEVNPTSLTYQPIPLTYTIHFQNTGTANANNIYILDTLDSELDLNSFRFLGASHYCIPQILQGGILRFNFPNINLPDSNSNEPASHGWAQYSIEQRSDIDPFSVIIENTANIYFDFNSAVVTNTTVTPFAEGIEEQKTANDFILYPNPATSQLTLMLRQAQHDNFTIEIKDALGRKVFSKTTEQKKQSINISALPSGIYFVEIFSGDGYSSTKKLVVVK